MCHHLDDSKPIRSSELKLCVVIVNYRSAALVVELLDSIASRGIAWVNRVVIVDNASGDDSIAILRARINELRIDDWVSVLDARENRGFGHGNNCGVAAAKRNGCRPDVLWFLNPDTLVHNVDLEQALAWFQRDSRIGIVGTGLDDATGGRDLGGHRDVCPLGEFVRLAGAFGFLQKYSTSDPSLDRPGPVDWVSGASLMMRASLFEQIGGFDEKFFLYFEEVDLCRRARHAGWSVVYEPRVRVVHLEGQTTGVGRAKSRPKYWYESRRRYFLKHFGVLGLLRADIAWGLGSIVARLRRRSGDGCHLRELWRCDRGAFLRLENVTMGAQE